MTTPFTAILKNINHKGSSHILIPMLIVLGVAVYGTYTLIASHAAPVLYPIAFVKTSLITPTSTSQTETLKTIDPATLATKTYATASGSQQWVSGGTYSPDHKYLAWFSYSTTLYNNPIVIQNLATGAKKTVQMPKNTNSINTGDTNIKWFPDSSKLAVVTSIFNSTTGQNTETLRMVNADGTGLKTVATLPSGLQIVSFAPSGDGKSLVYATYATSSDAVYSVSAGTKAVKVHAGSCTNVRTLPASIAVAYVCSGTSTNAYAQTIFKSNPGTTNAAILHKFVNGTGTTATGYSVSDITPTQDGKNLAVLDTKTVGTASCEATEQVQVGTMPVAANAALKTVYNGPVSAPRAMCMGGMPGDVYFIQWSTDDTKLAFIPFTQHGGQAAEALDVLTVSSGAVQQLDAGPIDGLSW